MLKPDGPKKTERNCRISKKSLERGLSRKGLRGRQEKLTGLVESVAQAGDGSWLTEIRKRVTGKYGRVQSALQVEPGNRAACSRMRGGRTGATAPRREGRDAGGRARALFEGVQPVRKGKFERTKWLAHRVLQISVTWSLLQESIRCSFATATFRTELGTEARLQVRSSCSKGTGVRLSKGVAQVQAAKGRTNNAIVGGKANAMQDVRNGSTRLLPKEGVSLKKKGLS